MFALLTGDHGEGKTTTCRKLAEQAQAIGASVGGIIQPAVYQANTCIGYDVLDLASGRLVRLATIGSGGEEHVGRFQFLPDGLAFGKAALLRAADERPALIIVDEVGPLELAGGGWSEQLDQLARTGTARRAGLARAGGGLMLWSVRRKLAPEVEARWSTPSAATSEYRALRRHDLSSGADAIIGDIIMSLQRESV